MYHRLAKLVLVGKLLALLHKYREDPTIIGSEGVPESKQPSKQAKDPHVHRAITKFNCVPATMHENDKEWMVSVLFITLVPCVTVPYSPNNLSIIGEARSKAGSASVATSVCGRIDRLHCGTNNGSELVVLLFIEL